MNLFPCKARRLHLHHFNFIAGLYRGVKEDNTDWMIKMEKARVS